MVFVATYLTVDAVYLIIFGDNVFALPQLVIRGDLDYYLLRPVASLFFLSTREIATSAVVNLLVALAILLWAFNDYPGGTNPGRFILFFLALFGGTFLYFCLRIFLVLPVFWLHSLRGFEGTTLTMDQFKERPDVIFKGWIRRILTTVLPYSLIASYPVRILFDPGPLTYVTHIFGVSIMFLCILCLYWRGALRVYSSASS